MFGAEWKIRGKVWKLSKGKTDLIVFTLSSDLFVTSDFQTSFLVERTRTITSEGKLEQIVIVEGGAPYKVVYRRRVDADEKDDSMTLSDFDSEGEESEEK